MARVRALVIGVDAVSGSCDDDSGYDRDARRFASLLTDCLGFDPTELRLLVNWQACRRNVVAALHWLLNDVQDGDIRVFYFSGLGFRVPSDGLLREVLVLHDGSYLFDNEISFLTHQSPRQAVTMVLDTCFDGGLDQRLGGPELGSIKAWRPNFSKIDLLDYRERFAEMSCYKPYGCQPVSCSRSDMLEMQFGNPVYKDAAETTMNAILVKACLDHEVAVTGRSGSGELSAFTSALCQFLESQGGFVNGVDAIEGAATQLAAMGVGQRPQHIYPSDWRAHDHLSFIAQAPLEDTTAPDGIVADTSNNANRGGYGSRLDPFLRMLPPSFEGPGSRQWSAEATSRKREVSDESE
jgi:Caspase domain